MWNTATNKIRGDAAFYQILGIPNRKDYEFDELLLSVHPGDLRFVQQNIKYVLAQNQSIRIEFRYLKPGRTIVLEVIRNANLEESNNSRIVGSIQDISAKKEFEQRLFQSIEKAHELERKKIAADLHDGACQYLATAKMLIQSLQKKGCHVLEEQPDIVERTLFAVEESLRLTRTTSHQLVPMILYDQGLQAAIEQMVETLNIADKSRYFLKIEGEIGKIDPQFAINIFRIIQEFLCNSQKYSNATRIQIAVLVKRSQLTIRLSDNGIGFDTKKKQVKSGIGLFNIKNRVQSLGGRYKLKSDLGKGVKLTVLVPIDLP